ncbi:MAG TPA: ferritin family protein [Candidatus Limnocylindria bacterium]|nr:ferritin family protein [Candidatus Limnocylindria bacterium]
MKWICEVCGFIYEGEEPPAICPVCKVGKEHFKPLVKGHVWADEGEVGLVRGIDPKVQADLRVFFQEDCREAALYLAMGRAADREGYPEAASLLYRIAAEEAQHAAHMAELLGEGLSADTRSNMRQRLEAEVRSCREKKNKSDLARQLGYGGLHDALHEMSKDDSRQGRALEGLLKRLFPDQEA